MVSDWPPNPIRSNTPMVLILVLMEYGLWHWRRLCWLLRQSLNPCSNGIWSLTIRDKKVRNLLTVLILVLMEYGLWHMKAKVYLLESYCLNPCSNGIWSLTKLCRSYIPLLSRLNPCSNGIWSLTLPSWDRGWRSSNVLILVLMEYGLWLTWGFHRAEPYCVLILVLMEYGLWLPPPTLQSWHGFWS